MKTRLTQRQELPVAFVVGLGGLLTLLDANAAQPWAACDLPGGGGAALASSADGTTLVAVSRIEGYFYSKGLPIFVSTDAGSSWITTSSLSNKWTSLTCSADGTRMAATAAPYRDVLYRSPFRFIDDSGVFVSEDSGTTWTRTGAPTNNWTSIASSANGKTIVAASAPTVIRIPLVDAEAEEHLVGDGSIYRSLDSGATWARTAAPTYHWTSLACSADGRLLAALGSGGEDSYFDRGPGWIYRSSDSGQTWTQSSAPYEDWASVAISADGTLQLAVANAQRSPVTQLEFGGGLCISIDAGVTWTWTPTPPPGITWWRSSGIRCKADGRQWFLNSDQTYTSRDSGRTWEAVGGQASATALVVSADGYRIMAGGYPPQRHPYAGRWRFLDLPNAGVDRITLSPDGARWVAAGYPGVTLTSTNSGTTWTRASTPATNLMSFTSSTDGTRCVVVNYWPGAVYSSTDSGATWIQAATTPMSWTDLAASADGTRLAATATDSRDQWGILLSRGAIYSSSDSGRTWSPSDAPTNDWSTIACSADGSRWIAGSWRPGTIYRSSDAGAHWIPTSAPVLQWEKVASSADGTVVLAGGNPSYDVNLSKDFGQGGIYRSLDSGATWALTALATEFHTMYHSFASTADGRRWVAAVNSVIYISTDSGATWKFTDTPAAWSWPSIACSADGSRILALSEEGAFATLYDPAPEPPLPPSPRLNVNLSGPELDLSWLVPSTRFVLQQTAALGSGAWADVSTAPRLDLSNLHERLSLIASPGNRYFRLKQQ